MTTVKSVPAAGVARRSARASWRGARRGATSVATTGACCSGGTGCGPAGAARPGWCRERWPPVSGDRARWWARWLPAF